MKKHQTHNNTSHYLLTNNNQPNYFLYKNNLLLASNNCRVTWISAYLIDCLVKIYVTKAEFVYFSFVYVGLPIALFMSNFLTKRKTI